MVITYAEKVCLINQLALSYELCSFVDPNHVSQSPFTAHRIPYYVSFRRWPKSSQDSTRRCELVDLHQNTDLVFSPQLSLIFCASLKLKSQIHSCFEDFFSTWLNVLARWLVSWTSDCTCMWLCDRVRSLPYIISLLGIAKLVSNLLYSLQAYMVQVRQHGIMHTPLAVWL